MRKAQLTLILITGLVVISLLGILLVYTNSSKEKSLASQKNSMTLEQHASQISAYVEQCMSESSIPEIYLLGSGGGYFGDAPSFGALGQSKIAYWYKDGKDISPELSTLESNLASRMYGIFINNCTDFREIESLQGLSITEQDNMSPSAAAKINQRDIEISFFYPIEIERDGEKKDMEKFTTRVNIPLGSDFSLAKRIISKAKNSTSFYDISADCGNFSHIAQQTNVYYANNIILVNDYSTFFDNRFADTYQLRIMVPDLKVNGRCTG
jgi:hypothetical protein